jgi:hypothetical protein
VQRHHVGDRRRDSLRRKRFAHVVDAIARTLKRPACTIEKEYGECPFGRQMASHPLTIAIVHHCDWRQRELLDNLSVDNAEADRHPLGSWHGESQRRLERCRRGCRCHHRGRREGDSGRISACNRCGCLPSAAPNVMKCSRGFAPLSATSGYVERYHAVSKSGPGDRCSAAP